MIGCVGKLLHRHDACPDGQAANEGAEEVVRATCAEYMPRHRDEQADTGLLPLVRSDARIPMIGLPVRAVP